MPNENVPLAGMKSSSPLTQTPAARFSRSAQALPPIDTGSPYEENDNDIKTRVSLEQGWKQAAARFKEKTNKDLGDFKKGSLDGVLGTLRKKYADDNKDTKKQDELYASLGTVLNGVELVGSIASQAASVVFGSAGMCFNALEILLNIPRSLKSIADSLRELFDEITKFLVQFQIFKRLDSRSMLDTALVGSTNEILLALVDVVAVCITVADHPGRAMMGLAFLKNDRVADALSKFRKLVDGHNKLTNVVTLDSVLQNKTMTQDVLRGNSRIEETSQAIHGMMQEVYSDSRDSKNMKLIGEMVLEIEKALGVTTLASQTPLKELERRAQIMFNDTINALEKEKEYLAWEDSKEKRKVLFLKGNAKTGKSHLLGALAHNVEKLKQQAQNHKYSIYLAYFAFQRTEDSTARDGGTFETPLHTALRVVAAQVARQSTQYAKLLHQSLDNFKGQKSLRELWSALKLTTFTAPPGSTLFLFFDGLDQVKGDLKEFGDIMKSALSPQNSNEESKLRFRIVFTGPEEIEKKLEAKFPTIDASRINDVLLQEYVRLEMKQLNIFQETDVDTTRRAQMLLKDIPELACGRFDTALQKLMVVQQAIEEDANEDELGTRLTEANDFGFGGEGKVILEKVYASLSEQHRSQLRELLFWAYVGMRRLSIKELEASLFLQSHKQPLEALERKIRTRFQECLVIQATYDGDDLVLLPSAIQQYLWDTGYSHTVPKAEYPSTISVNINMQNVEVATAQQFFWDLHTAIAGGHFDFSKSHDRISEGAELPSHSELEAHELVVRRCLTALNDDRYHLNTWPLITYAARHLPSHLSWLESSDFGGLWRLSEATRREVGSGLVNFLCDREVIVAAWKIATFSYEEWFSLGNVESLFGILTSADVQSELEPLQRRWAVKHTPEDKSPDWMMRQLALAAGTMWLDDRQQACGAYECFAFVDAYIDAHDRFYEQRERRRRRMERSRSSSRSVYPNRRRTGRRRARSRTMTTSNNSSCSHSPIRRRSRSLSRTFPNVETDTKAATTEAAVTSLQTFDRRTSIFGPIANDIDKSAQQTTIVTREQLEAEGFLIRANGITEKQASDNTEATAGQHPSGLTNGLVPKMVGYSANDEEEAPSNGDAPDQETFKERAVQPEALPDLQPEEINSGGQLPKIGAREDTTTDRDDTKSSLTRSASRSRSASAVRRPFPKANVEQTVEWVMEHLHIEYSPFVYERIGLTLLGMDNKGAIEYLEKAADSQESPTRLMGLAKAYQDEKEWTKAIESLQAALELFRARHERLKPELEKDEIDKDKDNLFDCLDQLADCYLELDRDEEAIDPLEEALRCCADNNETRAQLIKLLCKAKRYEKARDLYDDWEENFAIYEAQSPAKFLAQTAREAKDLDELLFPIHGDGELFAKILKTLSRGIQEAIADQRTEDLAYTLVAHGVALAIGREETHLQTALESWTSCIGLNSAMVFDNDDPFTDSSLFISQYYFDTARRQYNSTSSWTTESRRKLVTDLKARVDDALLPQHKQQRVIHTPMMYVTALCSLTGDLDIGKDILRPEMANAIEILGDEDPDNDHLGLFILTKLLKCYGDINGALSAWSLLDRRTLRKRIKEKQEAESAEAETNDVPLESTEAAKQQTNGQSSLEKDSGAIDTTGENIVERKAPEGRPDKDLDGSSMPPLPEGWIANKDPKWGHYYYIHLKTEHTQWEFPTSSASSAGTAARRVDNRSDPPPLPEGWIAHLDPKWGQYYYIHLETEHTQWEFPTNPAPPARIGKTRTDEDKSDTASIASTDTEIENWIYTNCNCCDTEVSSSDTENAQWWCKFCYDLSFCTDCLKKLKEGTMEKYICHPDHEFWRMKHCDYPEEDIEGMKVRIDWIAKWNEDGSDYTREAGRVVDLKDWLEILRKDWGIEATTTTSEGRIQK